MLPWRPVPLALSPTNPKPHEPLAPHEPLGLSARLRGLRDNTSRVLCIGWKYSGARLAQSAERKALNLVVVGSSPTVGVLRLLALIRLTLFSSPQAFLPPSILPRAKLSPISLSRISPQPR